MRMLIWENSRTNCDTDTQLIVLSHGDGQGGLACCKSWGCKDSDMTE